MQYKLFPRPEYYYGALRLTNPITLQRWKDNGEFQKLIDEGYTYHPGCGRFIMSDACNCIKCRKYEKVTINTISNHID